MEHSAAIDGVVLKQGAACRTLYRRAVGVYELRVALGALHNHRVVGVHLHANAVVDGTSALVGNEIGPRGAEHHYAAVAAGEVLVTAHGVKTAVGRTIRIYAEIDVGQRRFLVLFARAEDETGKQ